MENSKNKVRLGILILSVFILITSVSYAIWSVILQQESSNVVNTACFKINFTDKNEINLLSAYPISDEEGISLTPYTFAIENICNTNATYQINLEELTTELKKLSKEYIKVSLNNSKGKLLNTYETIEKTLSNAESSKKLTTGVLKAGNSKTFELRLWLDENTPAVNDVMNASFQSKITIIAVQKEGLPEVEVVAQEELDGITVDISTVENPKNETLTYFYQLDEEAEIESEENTHTFTGLSDGKYKARGRAETLDGIILEEKELEVTVAYEQVYVSASGSDETGNGSTENPYSTLQPAYNKVKSGGEILLLSDITATSTTYMNIENKEVTLKSNGTNTYSIFRGNNLKQKILEVTNKNLLKTSKIIFDGNNIEATDPLIYIENANFIIETDTIVKNGKNDSGTGGGIRGVDGIITLDGGNILNNYSADHGGGLCMLGGTFNMKDGIISNNIAAHRGGGFIMWQGNINIFGGNILKNSANEGGGLAITSTNIDVALRMSGGLIQENNATSYGGGVYIGLDGASTLDKIVFYFSGGMIIGNTAPNGANTGTGDRVQIIDQR